MIPYVFRLFFFLRELPRSPCDHPNAQRRPRRTQDPTRREKLERAVVTRFYLIFPRSPAHLVVHIVLQQSGVQIDLQQHAVITYRGFRGRSRLSRAATLSRGGPLVELLEGDL